MRAIPISREDRHTLTLQGKLDTKYLKIMLMDPQSTTGKQEGYFSIDMEMFSQSWGERVNTYIFMGPL